MFIRCFQRIIERVARKRDRIETVTFLVIFETKLEETCVFERDGSQYISPEILIVATRQLAVWLNI